MPNEYAILDYPRTLSLGIHPASGDAGRTNSTCYTSHVTTPGFAGIQYKSSLDPTSSGATMQVGDTAFSVLPECVRIIDVTLSI